MESGPWLLYVRFPEECTVSTLPCSDLAMALAEMSETSVVVNGLCAACVGMSVHGEALKSTSRSFDECASLSGPSCILLWGFSRTEGTLLVGISKRMWKYIQPEPRGLNPKVVPGENISPKS